MNASPSVSVVVPCYNYGHYLTECAESALSQHEVDVEVVIVDDASPDGSVAVAHDIAAKDERVRVIENKVNQGHIATYNIGLAAVTGQYVVQLSADDLLAPGALGRSVALLEARPEVTFVYGYAPEFTDRPPKARTNVRSWSVWSGSDWLGHICRRGSNIVTNPEVVMRSAMVRELGGYDARLPHSADMYLWMGAAARGGVGRINGCDQAFYRVHGSNMHLVKYAGVLTDITERRRTFEYFFAENHMADSHRLHQRARRALAREAMTLAGGSLRLGDSDTATALAEFAAETFPKVRGRRLWRAYERHAARDRNGRGLSLGQRANAVTDDVAARLRWRRWRRYGI